MPTTVKVTYRAHGPKTKGEQTEEFDAVEAVSEVADPCASETAVVVEHADSTATIRPNASLVATDERV